MKKLILVVLIAVALVYGMALSKDIVDNAAEKMQNTIAID